MTWLAERTERGVVHVTPMDDLIEHEQAPDCVCIPKVERILDRDKLDAPYPVWAGVIFKHSSLDGRELAEHDHEPHDG